MSRYTKKNHGLTIGWDNNFFYFVPNPVEGEPRTVDFPCIVSVSQYYFDNSVAYYAKIKTPAEQLLIAERAPRDDETVSGEDPSDFDFSHFDDPMLRARLIKSRMDNRRKICMPTEMARKWLDANAPGWGCPENYSSESFSFYFAKKSHANAFCKWAESILAGMHFS